MAAVITKELAIKAVLLGACEVPKVGTPLSKISTSNLYWAEDNNLVSPEEVKEKTGSNLPLWVMSGYGYGYGYGDGSGDGYGDGSGDGSGSGSGSGDGYGYGSGSGYGYGYGSGYGYGDGSGSGDGYGYGSGSGYGYGYGYGSGSGDGYGYGDGSGSGDGYGDGSGYGLYYAKIWGDWFEISGSIENSLCKNIPEHHYDKITKEFLHKVDNLECLRELREKIGLQKYLSLFDAKLIDEDTDQQGNQMRLFKYDEKGTMVILLEVVCPSTERMYHLYPPNQKAKNVWDAKASTFNKSKSNFNPQIET